MHHEQSRIYQGHGARYGRGYGASYRACAPRRKGRHPRRRRRFGGKALLVVLLTAGAVVWSLTAADTSPAPDAITPPAQAARPDQIDPPIQAVQPDQTEAAPELSGLPGDVAAFAAQHGLTAADYPQSILAMLARNPETEAFVLNYPLEYGKEHKVNLHEYQDLTAPPLFLQWDRRWGYLQYGDNVAGVTGCGPVTLAMAGYYLTGSDDFRPDRVIEFALENGYCVPGHGSSWSLISQGGTELGLDVQVPPLDKGQIVKNLEAGHLVICVMGPGIFTRVGHFLLLTGVEDGKFRINDANSRANSARLWSYEEIQDQIQNLWALKN